MLFRSDDYEHCNLSIKWLITRGARATSIRASRSNLTSDRQITDMTFAGVGILCTHNVNSVDQGFLSWLGMNCDTSNGLNKAVFIRTQGLSQVTSIDLYNCQSISDIGVSAIEQGCPLLTSIGLDNCHLISDVGVSAIAEGCPLLTSINLQHCYGISVIGVLAIAQSCPLLTSIDLCGCDRLTETALSLLRIRYPYLSIQR